MQFDSTLNILRSRPTATKEITCFFSNKFRYAQKHVPALKIAIFWDVAACSLVDIDRRFKGAHPDVRGSKIPETLVSIYQTTLCNIPFM
jgi:hypothetical protein